MTVDTGTPPSATRRHAAFHPLAVAAVDRLTDDAVVVTFDVPPELREAYRFLPGQHVSLRFPTAGDDARRSYSICSSATSGLLQVAVKRLSGGVFSAYALDRLRPGEIIDVLTPGGRFTVPLHPGQEKHYCAIAAGSGITPIMSIFSTALEVEPGSRCTLIYGNRTTNSIMFLEELEDLKDRYPQRLQLLHVLSQERLESALLTGRVDGERLSAILDALVPPSTVDEWLLCGPAVMVDMAREVLLARGVDPARVHRELFHVGPVAPRRREEQARAAGAAEVTVVLEGRASSFPLARDTQPILEAALAVRGDAPYACKNGMCGTCRARLVEGTVEMDHNYALEEDELAAGFVLACQSYPTSDRVTLDFDA